MSESRIPGRPRSESVRQAILEAAFALLVDKGYAAFALEAVAQAAGAGKSTIYRWWDGRAALAVDAFFEATREELRFPDTGSAREDFRVQIMDLSTLLRGRRGEALAAMLGGARSDPKLARALGERWLEPRRRWGVARMADAAREGELNPGVDPQAALAVLYGPLYTPLLFGGSTPGPSETCAYLEIALAGVFRP